MSAISIKKNYFYNLSYQILLIIAPIITVPYVSRILTPEGIGIYSFTASIASYFILFGLLGSNLYGQREIAYHRDDQKKKAEVACEIILLRLVTVSISVLLFFLFIQLLPEYKVFLLIQSLEIISVIFDIAWYYQGQEKFKILSIRNISIRLLGIVLVFLFVKNSHDLYKYIWIIVGCSFLTSFFLFPSVIKDIFKQNINLKKIKPFKHLRKILYLFVPQIAMQIYTVLDKTMIGFITKSSLENGYYEQAIKIIRLLMVIVTSLGTVMTPRISNLNANNKHEEIRAYLIRSFSFVLLVSLPMMIGIQNIASRFVPIFFGEGYENSIILLQILSCLFLIIGLNNVTGIQYLIPLKKENIFTITVTSGAIINILFNFFLIPRFKAMGAAIASVIAESVITIMQFIYIRKIFSFKKLIKGSWKYFAASFFILVILKLLNSLLPLNIAGLAIMIISGVVFYVIFLFVLRDEFVLSTLNKALKKDIR
ncbi:flippase [Breznakiella homolactica]|uniref:Flippase n=1 Tax=Breznakiella homolactica TaxID=2798577 RepID=A0A7T7XP42_9SPIR|nr:flippase [Breznakiella homolactica]QQO09808.1 flippase [Breznakiella homolactica]